MRNSVLINGLIIACAIGSGVVVTMGPWRVFRTQKAQAEQRVRVMNEAEERGIKLMEAEDRAQSSIGKEEAARKAGYIPAGETLVYPEKK